MPAPALPPPPRYGYFGFCTACQWSLVVHLDTGAPGDHSLFALALFDLFVCLAVWPSSRGTRMGAINTKAHIRSPRSHTHSHTHGHTHSHSRNILSHALSHAHSSNYSHHTAGALVPRLSGCLASETAAVWGIVAKGTTSGREE